MKYLIHFLMTNEQCPWAIQSNKNFNESIIYQLALLTMGAFGSSGLLRLHLVKYVLKTKFHRREAEFYSIISTN